MVVEEGELILPEVITLGFTKKYERQSNVKR